MSEHQAGPAAIARAYTDAVNRHDYAEAADLLAEDVELIFPGARLEGREAWLESRRKQQPAEHLAESVEVDRVGETANSAELTGRLVQRWAESGDVAAELPVRLEFTVVGGEITRLAFVPLPGA